MSSISLLGMGYQQEAPHNELSQKAYKRLKSLAQVLTAQQATIATCTLSKWAKPTYI